MAVDFQGFVTDNERSLNIEGMRHFYKTESSCVYLIKAIYKDSSLEQLSFIRKKDRDLFFDNIVQLIEKYGLLWKVGDTK
jgi:hypothetical protein